MESRRQKKRIVIGVSLLVVTSALVLGGTLLKSMESRSDLVPVGQVAPDFTTAASDGQTVHLADIRGKKRVVLVFYPGDNTPVCTAQLCAFRDNWHSLEAENTVVYGINPAGQERHSAFAKKIALPFPLLVDTKNEIASRYGCLALFGIVKRTVYVLDLQGKVAWAERGNPSPAKILQLLKTLQD